MLLSRERASVVEDESSDLRAGAGWESWRLLSLVDAVLLSTSAPKALPVSFDACDRAGFCCALGAGTLAATSDVRPTTGDPLKTSSGGEVSKERAISV